MYEGVVPTSILKALPPRRGCQNAASDRGQRRHLGRRQRPREEVQVLSVPRGLVRRRREQVPPLDDPAQHNLGTPGGRSRVIGCRSQSKHAKK